MSLIPGLDLSRCVLLDNESSVHAFFNPKLFHIILKVNNSMTLHSNGGMVSTKMQCNVENLDQPFWFIPDYITNILSLISKLYHVTYDSADEHAFIMKADLRSYLSNIQMDFI